MRQTIARGAAAAAGLLVLATVAIVWGPAGMSGSSPWFGDSDSGDGRVASGAPAMHPRDALPAVTGHAAHSPVVPVVAEPRVASDTGDTIVSSGEVKIASASRESVVATTGVAEPKFSDASADGLNDERNESSRPVAGATDRMPADPSIGIPGNASRSDRVTASRVTAAPAATLFQPQPPARDNGSEPEGAAPAARVSVPFPISEPTFPVPDVRPETIVAGGGAEVVSPNTPAPPVVSAPKSSATPARQRDAAPQDPRHDDRPPASTAVIDEAIPGVRPSEQPLTRDAVLVSGPPPRYPESVRRQEQGGAVDVEITIDAQGRVVDARALFGPRPLWSFAEAAVLRWRFDPARADGIPIASRRRVRLLFQ